MDWLLRELAASKIIGLDTSIFIYHFESNPVYFPLTSEILTGVERGEWEAITSVITLMEINVHPLQLGRQDIAQKYEVLLVNFPNLKVVDLNRDITRSAAQLRAKYRLRPADALQVSAVMSKGGNAFITNDQQLARLRTEIEIFLLDDII